MEPPRWLADEMLGRLARYLRFLGHDTEYVRDLDDTEIVRRAAAERRRLLTRDRELAARVDGSVLLRSPHLPDQLRAVREAEPGAGYALRFDRCSLCNGRLSPEAVAPDAPLHPPSSRGPVYRCERCRHEYWEGSHTARIRLDVARWLGP